METKKIGNFEIGEKQLKQFMSRLPQDQQAYAETNEQFRKGIETRLEEIALFAAYGEEMGLEEREEIQEALAASRRDYISQLAMSELLKDITADDAEAEAFYEEHKSDFTVPATAVASHILVDDEAKAAEVKAQIEAGEVEFAAAAEANSSCPSKAQGGSLGQFQKGQMVKEFDEAVFAAKAGDLLGPVQTQFGYHIIKVDAVNEGMTQTYEEAKEQVKQLVIYNKQSEVYDAKLAELKSKYL
ncbi:MAG: peptidyl-prolyl cis-trans isomerase [Firmicutes bacterium]|nr:peptidyl-prolyl cis-trans isomerase [Bacillota bacterium]